MSLSRRLSEGRLARDAVIFSSVNSKQPMPPSPAPESFARETDPPIRGWLHAPSASNGNGLVLAHGAGSSAQAPLLVALSEAFSGAGFTVLRIDLPYRQTRSFGPPSPATAARDRAGGEVGPDG